MTDPAPPWLADALRTPLLFAQVREDALQDLELARRLEGERGRPVRVLLVGSGGCTAAALAAEPGVAGLVLADPNPAQLALCRLKLQLLVEAEPAERLALLGHAALDPAERARALERRLARLGLEPDALGPRELVARLGPDQSGRYEQLFAALRADLAPVQDGLAALLAGQEPARQAARVAPGTPLGEALERAYARAFDLPLLVALFGAGATANRVLPFAEHFLLRTRAVCGALPARDNPWLWQLLAGRYPPGRPVPWLERPATGRLPEVRCEQGLVDQVLAGEPQPFDLIHVSNVLDWLTPEQAGVTLARVHERLAPGGAVIVRQLNSSLDVRASGPALRWDLPLAAELHARDRSFFYRDLHVGWRPD